MIYWVMSTYWGKMTGDNTPKIDSSKTVGDDMRKRFQYKNKIVKRAASFVLVLALILTGLPADIIPEEKIEHTNVVKNVKAEEDLDGLKATYSGDTHIFTSGDGRLSEYSQCFQDATWAAAHANDKITLNPFAGKFIFDENYNPIGNESAAFYGTIYFTTSADDFAIDAHAPIFNYVKDSVQIGKLADEVLINIPLNITRVADAGDTVSPLFANHVVGSGAETPYEWKITLNSASAKSYSGVIYEMTDGAKIKLTFADNSDHTPGTDANGNITSGSIIDNKESNTNYGILCGAVKGSSVLKAIYTKTNEDDVTFIGTETAYCGGLIGEIKDSTFELLSGSSDLKVAFETAKNRVGFICGHAEDSTITLPSGYTFSGNIDGNVYAGGIAGYCKNTLVNYETTSGTISLSGCNVNSGGNASATGGVFGYYECDSLANDILLNRTYALTECTVVGGKGYSGGVAGEYRPTYTDAVSINLDHYTQDNNTITLSGTIAGGLFGKYTAKGNVTITDTDTNTEFTPPQSTVSYGGVIGEYANDDYTNTLTLSGFTVNNLTCASTGNVGGVIGVLNGSTYVSVSGVSITNANIGNAGLFGGVVSTLDNNNVGSFIDVTGNLTLSLSAGTYKGGAVAGSFKKGVIRLAGVTDISGAQAANGYAQLVYENDETLVYAKGSGSDGNWTLKRNADTTASDLGQWGEVVRMFNAQNAEEAGIVSVSDNKVTVAAVEVNPTINNQVSFAKVALNMQLNDGSNHGALCFAGDGANKTALLGSTITVSGEIDLAGTGLLGLMRDGGNGKYLQSNSNTFQGSPDFFTGSISGTSAATDKILLAIGEAYGCDADGTTLTSGSTGGRIYLSENWGHDAQGLIAFGKAASFNNITIDGNMHVSRVASSNHLYMSPLMGAMTNGATLTNVTVNTTMTADRADNAKFYIGGVSGVFDGKETTNNPYVLSITGSKVAPVVNLTGSVTGYNPADSNTYENSNTYAGGVIGLLKGADSTQYNVSISNTDVSPTIALGNDVDANPDYSYIGGMIGRVKNNTTNARSIELTTVTMTGARVDTRAKYPGGLLGAMWDRTNLTVEDLTITGATVNHKYGSTGSKQSGLVFRGSGKWDIKSLSISSSSFISSDTKPASFGLIVNEAYNGNDGLYINLLNRGYSLTDVTVPTASADGNYYVDEIAADTKNNNNDGNDITIGGNGTGIVNINMNIVDGTETKIVDGANGTGTYQNRLSLGNLIANQNSRYYYNLDVMMSKGDNKTDGEKFLLWSVNQYAATNIKTNFVSAITGIKDIDLSGLSYYPIPVGEVTLGSDAVNPTITFGFQAINDYENKTITPDSWSRNPDDIGDPKTDNARNQHYLMQTGLFTTSTKLTLTNLTLMGDFGYVEGVAAGALINKSTSGSVALTGLTLNKLTPSNSDSYMLINAIDGKGTATPSLTVSNLRATDYDADGLKLPVAKSLFGTATGQNMTMTFSDIKLDARDGNTITDSKWTEGAALAMKTAYHTSRSIFSTATFFTSLLAAKTSNLIYNYALDEDWTTETTGPRNVTYGKEVTESIEYKDSEMHYYLAGEVDGHFTNPVSDSNDEFSFATGFLPYVGNYTDRKTNATYPITEIKVNYKAPSITEGCGTYNDPYIISKGQQFEIIAKAINGTEFPGTICLPNYTYKDLVSTTWHNSEKDSGIYNQSGTSYTKAESNSEGVSGWNQLRVRYYLASAYYKVKGNITLSDEFEGLGVPYTANFSNSPTKGNTVFHGVIVGDNEDKPTITNPTNNSLIVVANGAVIKNINIINTSDITREQTATGDNAKYGYDSSKAQYYGGVIGEIMGGDNIIDDVTVTYSGTTTLSGDNKHLIAEGGMVGAVVNGALIFRGSNAVTTRTVTGGGIYSNPFVGRVINGYAIFEKIDGRTGTAPDNYNTIDQNGNKNYTYPIDTINRSNTNKLDVNYTTEKIAVPDAQSLYIMSLITQSIASTAADDTNTQYGTYSPSYGYNNYITGVSRLGDYGDVGCGISPETVPGDYTDYASFDSINNYKDTTSNDNREKYMKAPIPYIIFRYTERYGKTSTNPAVDFPARKMTYNNDKYWNITLDSNTTFESFDNYKAFRGIGCVGINGYKGGDVAAKTAMKIATFNGGENTIRLHISLPRYERNKENYFHKQYRTLTQDPTGDELSGDYGHDSNLQKLMGLGLFDCVKVKKDNTHEYQFQNFILQGTIEDKVYDTNGKDITGTTDYTQLFCVGGVVGKRVTDNNSDLNFNNIRFDGLVITGAYSCGGLIGIDAAQNHTKMKIDGCNSTENGINIIGGYYGFNENLRHGIGSFVGMTFWCRPCIDGDNATTAQVVETSDIYVSQITSYYTGIQKRCNVGGLIGYSGTGAEIKNINLKGIGTNPVVGAETVYNAVGFIGFSQASEQNDNDYLQNSIWIENCTMENLSVKASTSAAGFYGRSNMESWGPRYIYITNSKIIGTSASRPEIRAYGTGTKNNDNIVGGFVLGFFSTGSHIGSIENSYISGYTIQGYNVGGLIGRVSQKNMNLKNDYVKDCDIITYNANSYVGGMVGYSEQNLSGYNLKIDNVNFKLKSGENLVDNASNSGIIVGGYTSANEYKFVGICAYNADASKVPTTVVNKNGTKNSNFFVFADYLNASAADITAGAGKSSTFGVTVANSAGQPTAPYVNSAPHMAMGTNEYLTGDGASIGKAGEIYEDIAVGTSKRRYAIRAAAVTDASVGNVTDSVTLARYINSDGSYKEGVFKISTASAEFGESFSDMTGVDNFAMLVINNDDEKSGDITPFIKSYIRLVTNAAAGTPNQYTFDRDAYSCGKTEINKLYEIVIRPCYYNEGVGKFVLGDEGDQGLKLYADTDTDNHGKYYFDSANADSESENLYQFSLIDVQFKDPTDTTYTQIAYHLYVPVYTKKMLTAEFSAVSLSETKYYRSVYAKRIALERIANRTAANPSQLVESTNAWTTTFIRYTYPKNRISANDDWNFDKSITLTLDGNFQTLPIGTKLILVDPNANVDKFYTLTIDEAYDTNTAIPLNLSSFVDESGNPFAPQNLSDILADSGASSTEAGHTNELYEDYYISMYVPKSNDYTHSVLFGCGTSMTHTIEEEVYKANIEAKLYSLVILGDLFIHNITGQSFSVDSGDGATYGDNPEMTATNNVLKTEVTATVQIKNRSAGAYLASSDVYHAFFITLTSHDAEHKVSDIIYGITPGYISNTTTYSYTNSSGSHTVTKNNSSLGANYIELDTGSIINALYDPTSTPVVTIHSVTTMTFNDVTAFPYNESRAEKIGTQVSIKSNLAYREADLRFSAMNVLEEDPDGKFYYSTTQNNAELTFNAVPADDTTDEIGLKTNNRSLLGVNGKYGTSHPVLGKAIYNVDDIVDYESATAVQYTISLYKKVTDETGTRYVRVNNISNYLSNVNLSDQEVTFTVDRTTNPAEYVFTGTIDHEQQLDLDRMFEVDFSCTVLTGDAAHNEYANYKIYLTANLIGASNAWKDAYLIYTNAKFDPSVIDESN